MADSIKWTKGSVEELKRWLKEKDENENQEAREGKLDFPWPVAVKDQRTIWGSAKDATIQTTLSFDEVPGAEDYEIRLAIVEQTNEQNPGSGTVTPGAPQPGGGTIGPILTPGNGLTAYAFQGSSTLVDVTGLINGTNPAGCVPTAVPSGDTFRDNTLMIAIDPSDLIENCYITIQIIYTDTASGTRGINFMTRDGLSDLNIFTNPDYPGCQWTNVANQAAVTDPNGRYQNFFTYKMTTGSGYGWLDPLSSSTNPIYSNNSVGTNPADQPRFVFGFNPYGALPHTWTVRYVEAYFTATIPVNPIITDPILGTPPATGDPGSGSGSGGGLPYNPGTSSSAKKVFAHYMPQYPISLDNKDPAVDFYQTAYLTPSGEGGKHSAYGGLLRDRPVPKAVSGAGSTAWSLVWSDEFNGSSVNTSDWNVRTDTQSNHMGRNQTANVTVSGGALHIRSGTDNPVDPVAHPWTSGYLDTIGKKSWQSGKWEIRCRFPWGTTGKGFWPAFWLRPDDGGIGEVDIFEGWPGANDVHQTLWRDYTGTPHVEGPHKGSPGFDPTTWHTYSVELETDSLKFYTDDVLVWDATNSATWRKEAFNRAVKWNIRLQLQMGAKKSDGSPGYGGWPDGGTNLALTYDVDYVRYYQRTVSDGAWQANNAMSEINQAKSAGIDGFMCNILALSTATSTNRSFQDSIFQAATTVGGFYCIPAIDGSALSSFTDDQIAETIDYYLNYGCKYQISTDYVVSTYSAESLSPSRWANIDSILSATYSKNIKWVFVFNAYSYVTGGTYDSLAYAYGTWGDRSPAQNVTSTGAGTPKQRILDAQAGGFKWVQAVSVQDERPNQHIYDESQNTQNLRNTWDIAIAGGADWVLIPTWNDYSTGTHIAPSKNHGWTYLDLCSYYIQEYKYGSAPTITQDAIYLTHRIQAAAATPSYAETSLMTLRSGSSSARDKIEALVFLKSAATVQISAGGTVSNFSGSSGINSFLVDINNGTVLANVIRAGATTASVTSSYPIVATPYVQDLGYYAAASLRSGYAAGGTSISGAPMPTVDPAGWTRVYEQDFLTPTTLGAFSADSSNNLVSTNPYRTTLKAYPNGVADTSRNGKYSPEKTMSAGSSVLDIYVHTDTGTPYGSAVLPILPSPFKYGRVDICMKMQTAVGYRTNVVLYPASGSFPNEGQIRWPISDSMGQNLTGEVHYALAAGGHETKTSTSDSTKWHIYSIEWTAGSVKLFLDGVQIGTTATSNIPSTPMNLIIEAETSLGSPPASTTAAHLQIDWIVAYV